MRCGAATGRLGIFAIGWKLIKNNESTVEKIPPPLRTTVSEKPNRIEHAKPEVRGWLALTFERLAFADCMIGRDEAQARFPTWQLCS